MTTQAGQRQINTILVGCNTTSSIKEYTNQAKREYDNTSIFFLRMPIVHLLVPPSPPEPMYAKNDDHDAFLLHCWNRSNNNKNTNTTKPT